MKNVKHSTLSSIKAQRGFTLVELVTVVMVIGILALSIAPKFSTSSGFTEYALQKRLIGSLRNVQLKSMHDTRSSFCYQINMITGSFASAGFGPSTSSYAAGNESASCLWGINADSPAYLRTQNSEVSDNNLTFTGLDNALPISFLRFDSMGRPISSAGSCAPICEFTFAGQSAAKVCVSNQGYVHAC